MSKVHFFMRMLMAVGVALVSAHVSAQAPVGAERPTPKVGDIWKSRTIDLWNGNELFTTQTELVEVQPERLILRSTAAPPGEVTTVNMTRDLQPCRSMKNSEAEICAGAFKFPLRMGDKHQFEKLPWTNGEGYFSEACEVKAQEQVNVTAGTFDTYRIECKGTWTRVIGGAFTGRVEETFWYAPKANRSVKSIFINHRPNGGMFERRQTELVEYLAK